MFGDLLTNLPTSVYVVVSATNEQERFSDSLPQTERMHAFAILFTSVADAERWIMAYGEDAVYFSPITYNILEYTRPPF